MERAKLPKHLQGKLAELNRAIFVREVDTVARLYGEILTEAPDYVLRGPVQYDLGRLLEQAERHELALRAYTAIILHQRDSPSLGPSLKGAGICAYKLGRFEPTVEHLEAFLATNPLRTDRAEVEELLSRLPPEAQAKRKKPGAGGAGGAAGADGIAIDEIPSSWSLPESSKPVTFEFKMKKKGGAPSSGMIKRPADIASLETDREGEGGSDDPESISLDGFALPEPKQLKPLQSPVPTSRPPKERPAVAPEPPTRQPQVPASQPPASRPPAPPPAMHQQPPPPPVPPPGYYPAPPPPGYAAYPQPAYYPGPYPPGYAPPPPAGYPQPPYPGHYPPPPPPGYAYGPPPPGYGQPVQLPPTTAVPPPPPPAPPKVEVPSAGGSSPSKIRKTFGAKKEAAEPPPPTPPTTQVKKIETASTRYDRLRDAEFALLLPVGKRIHLEAVAELVSKRDDVDENEARKKVLRRKGILYDGLAFADVLALHPLVKNCRQSLIFVTVPRHLKPYEHFDVTAAELRDQGLKLTTDSAVRRIRWDDIRLINCGQIAQDTVMTLLGSEPVKEYRFNSRTFNCHTFSPSGQTDFRTAITEMLEIISSKAPQAVKSHTVENLLNRKTVSPQPFTNDQEFAFYTLWILYSRFGEEVNSEELVELSQVSSNW